MLVSIIYSTYSTETRRRRVRSAYRRVQTRRQHTESTHTLRAARIVRRAAHAAHAATAAPGDRARATKPRKDRAVRVGQRPQPATQGLARPGPQRTAIDGRPLRRLAVATPTLVGYAIRLAGRCSQWTPSCIDSATKLDSEAYHCGLRHGSVVFVKVVAGPSRIGMAWLWWR